MSRCNRETVGVRFKMTERPGKKTPKNKTKVKKKKSIDKFKKKRQARPIVALHQVGSYYYYGQSLLPKRLSAVARVTDFSFIFSFLLSSASADSRWLDVFLKKENQVPVGYVPSLDLILIFCRSSSDVRQRRQQKHYTLKIKTDGQKLQYIHTESCDSLNAADSRLFTVKRVCVSLNQNCLYRRFHSVWLVGYRDGCPPQKFGFECVPTVHSRHLAVNVECFDKRERFHSHCVATRSQKGA